MSDSPDKYADLIHAERPWPGDTKIKHPPMSRMNRAAQFAPFEALRGHGGDLSRENWKLTRTQRVELSEDDSERLSDKLVQVNKGDEITVVCFVPDEGEMGCYENVSGKVAAIDAAFQTIQINKRTIHFKDIADVYDEGIISFDPFGI